VIVSDLVIVMTTIGPDRADELARTLVEERLAACVNVQARMMSTFRWNGRVAVEPECQLLVKTTQTRLSELEARIRQLHSYELPEFIVVRPDSASAEYLGWVRGETQSA
jgi:periplasmic divalent cation tolerance protein